MTNYGMPFFLEDKTGKLTGSEFVDINDRLKLTVRCTAHDAMHTAYMIYDRSNVSSFANGYPKPLVALDFGPNNSLGTVSFGVGGVVPMKEYLSKVSSVGG
jgi:hypothetical protein